MNSGPCTTETLNVTAHAYLIPRAASTSELQSWRLIHHTSSQSISHLIPFPTSTHHPAPMSYFSNLLTATKTRYATLRAGEDVDGETEDDSHISRVLRSYYTEQQRPLPPWLPPAPQAARTSSPVATSLRNVYGSGRRANSSNSQTSQASNASLADIWDAPAQPQQGQQQERPRFGSQRQQHAPAPGLFPDEGQGGGQGGPQQMTAQQRIKERLWGGRRNDTASPPPVQHTPPPQQMPQRRPVQMPQGPPERVEMPYVGAGMPWDDGAGAGYAPPQQQYAPPQGGNLRRGAGGNGQRPGGQPTGGPAGGRQYYR
ncbi:hypothetical protein EDC01DRAFT_645762, partial [Geopyxis carbonaria]